MHACGHDVHMAALTALGRAARALGPDLPTALLALLQPREETFPSGARDIIDTGALASHQPLAVIGVHLQHSLLPGTVGRPRAPSTPPRRFEITVTGRGGHAGYPHLAVTPCPRCARRGRAAAGHQPVRRPHPRRRGLGRRHRGRPGPHVIPETARALGSLRALDPADRPRLQEAVREIVTHTCRGYGCDGQVTITEGEPALVNDPALAAASWPWARQAGFAIDDAFRSCGADDFSYYLTTAPTLMLFVGTHDDITLHNAHFLPPDEAVGEVAGAMLGRLPGRPNPLTRPRPSSAPRPLRPSPAPRSRSRF